MPLASLSITQRGGGPPPVTAAYDAATRTLVGSAPASAQVIVTLDGVDQGTRPVADASGRWTFAVAGLSNGAHTFAARALVSSGGQTVTIGAGGASAGGTLDFSDAANSGHVPGI